MDNIRQIFSALIHDVGHVGISNRQLSSEGDDLAVLYNDQSVAEQHSLSVSFSLLYEKEYENLVRVIAPNVEERRKFRKLVIHIVMCTDIASPDRTQLMKSRWKEAFEVSRKQNLHLRHLLQQQQKFLMAISTMI